MGPDLHPQYTRANFGQETVVAYVVYEPNQSQEDAQPAQKEWKKNINREMQS